MRKKVLSALLALAMALSLLPGMALSDEWEPQEVGVPIEDVELSDASFEEAELSAAPFEEAELSAAPVSLRIVPPTTQTIAKGAAMDIRGLEVYAVYADGTEQAVTDYALSGLDSSEGGKKEVTVTYGGLTATFTITVDYIAGIAVIIKPKKRQYTQGEPLDMEDINKMQVLARHHVSANNEWISGDKCAVTGYNPNQLGVQTLIVSYGGKSAEFLVKVVPGSGQSTQTNFSTLEAPRIIIESVQGGKKVRFTRDGSMDNDLFSQYPGQTTKIYYTLDGSAPTPGAAGTFEYDNKGISIEETITVKAVAILGDETSTVASGRVSVPQVEAPKPANEHHKNNQGPDRTMTQLEPGTLVSFLCDTAGASIYYWFDGQSNDDAANHRYGSSVYIDRAYADANGVVTLNAYATKDGYQNSKIMKLKYQLPKEEPQQDELVNISVGTARSRAGEAVSTSLSITTEESSGVTGFTLTIRYDSGTFSFESVSPVETGGAQSEAVIPAEDLFVAPTSDSRQGIVRVMYNGKPVTGGEMCMLNFRVRDSAENSAYELTVDGESAQVSTSSGHPVTKKTYNGSITLEGSHNSQLTASVLFSGEDNRDASNVSQLSDSSNVTASISIDQESVQDYTNSLPRDESGNPPLTVVANAFVAFYDESGNMLSLETWEIDLSDLARLLFDRMMDLPEGAYDIKTMILSESLTPVMAAEQL